VTPEALLGALGLPPGCLVEQRVPKKLLLEHGAPTAADKRLITDGIEEVRWLAALKPATVGVPAYCDDVREYLEIEVLSVGLRDGVRAGRLAELIQRAVPYPVILLYTQGERVVLSLAHKRGSQGEAGVTVLDGELVSAEPPAEETDAVGQAFLASLPLAKQSRMHMFALYQGWLDVLVALQAARVTGTFALPGAPERAVARREALRECERLEAEIVRLRAAATKEKQVARLVDLNLEIKRLEQQLFAAKQRL
jgi:hypothetical protein